MGLHQRYASWLGDEFALTTLVKKPQAEIDEIAKQWASIIKNAEARKDAEMAARILLEHDIELPRLVKEKLATTTGAQYRAPMFEGDEGVIIFNERRERDYKSYKEKKIKYNSGSQDNTFLHEASHHIDALLEPKAYATVEHQWEMKGVDRKLIEKEVSRYALQNRAEFEAELISATLRGKTFSKEVLSYSNLNNPEQMKDMADKLLGCASGKNLNLPVEDLRQEFEDLMKVVYNQKGASLSISLIADKKAQDFIEKHADVLNRSLTQIPMSDAMRNRLQRSNYIFSGMKTFHELNEAFPSLLDENGNRKSFEAFLNDVRKIDETYNSNYLRAEYNFVQSSATMAAKWEEFAEDGDRYNLQYRTAGDSRVRPAHAELNGVTLPMSDSFWEEHYPPLSWNCRCSVVQVRKSKYPETPHDEAMALGEEALGGEKHADMFRFNSGIKQKAMPDYNPYTIRRCKDCDVANGKLKLAKFIPENELCEACRFLRQCAQKKDKDCIVETRKNILDNAERLNISSSSVKTGNYYQTKSSLKRALAHAYTTEEAYMFSWLPEHLDMLQYVRFSKLGEVKNMSLEKDIKNVAKKRNRGVTGYNIYEVSTDTITWIVKTEVYKDKAETAYIITKKE